MEVRGAADEDRGAEDGGAENEGAENESKLEEWV